MALITENYDDIVTFAHVLVDTGYLESPTSILSYFEKPWKWRTEYELWRELGGTLDADCVGSFSRTMKDK